MGLSGTADAVVLQWASDENRVVITHDVSTMSAAAYARIEVGQNMPGLVEIPEHVPVRQAIEDIILLAEASLPDEWVGHVIYLPLR